MTERASVFELAQIGLEDPAAPGTPVAADLVLEAVGWMPAKQGKVDAFRPEGMKFGTIASVGKMHAEWKLDGILDYVNILYLLRSLMHMEADPELVDGASAAYEWTFTSKASDADNGLTLTIERGSSIKAAQYAYGQITGLGFSFGAEDSTVKLSGAAITRAAVRGVSMTGSPDMIDAEPALPGQCEVKIATAAADLATANALARLLQLEWGFTGKYKPLFNIASDASYVAPVEVAPTLNGSLTLEADTDGIAIEAYAEAATPLWLEIIFTGPEIETSYNYSIDITMPIFLTTLGDAADSGGVWANKFGLQARHDATEETAITIVVTSDDIEDLHLPA